MDPKIEEINSCPICGKIPSSPSFPIRDFCGKEEEIFAFSHCSECETDFLSKRPPREEIGSYYAQDYQPYSGEYNFLTEIFIKTRTCLEIFRAKKKAGSLKNVLEIGCSWGKYLKELKNAGIVGLTGVEFSSEMARLGREKEGLDIIAGELIPQKFPAGSFDWVIMNHVIEHLYNPIEVMEEVFRILRPGGIAVIKTPNGRTAEKKIFGKYWIAYEAPRHLFVFSDKGLEKILKKIGFRDLNLKYEITPNNFILSARNFLISRNFPGKLIEFFSIKNYFILIFFLPFSLALGLFKSSGRMALTVKKP